VRRRPVDIKAAAAQGDDDVEDGDAEDTEDGGDDAAED